jgi:hypothetical protein
MIPQSRIDFIAKQIELNGKAEVCLRCWQIRKADYKTVATEIRTALPKATFMDEIKPGTFLYTKVERTVDLLTWEPTMKLRIAKKRDPVLELAVTFHIQQLWTNGKEEEWRDVPTEEV